VCPVSEIVLTHLVTFNSFLNYYEYLRVGVCVTNLSCRVWYQYFLILMTIILFWLLLFRCAMNTGIMNLISLFAGFVKLSWSRSPYGMHTKFLVSIVRWWYLQSHSCCLYGLFMFILSYYKSFWRVWFVSLCVYFTVTPNELRLTELLFWSGNK
jgi:hypothetical protein